MERFWVWSLYNAPKENESFPFYLARFREALLNGYIIKESFYDDYLKDTLELVIIDEKPKAKQTVNKSLAGVKSYMYYIDESQMLENTNFVDIIYENHKSKKGFLRALDIKKSHSYLETFGKKQSILKPFKVAAQSSQAIKAFPHKSFNALLEIAEPRERLLYLLLGACSSRIGQALSLTLYDIDYEKEEVWLLDPSSDFIDLYNRPRRQWLLNEYGIDMTSDKEHSGLSLCFKYPIPLKHEPLYWIQQEYKRMFFQTLPLYLRNHNYLQEHSRERPHPFVFITKTGKRYMPRGALSILKKHIKQLNKQGHNIPIDLGFHSLRHMFGVVMSEIYAKTSDESILFLTKEAMGHSNIESTMVYFNMTDATKKAKIEAAGKNIFREE
jgi:integrase